MFRIGSSNEIRPSVSRHLYLSYFEGKQNETKSTLNQIKKKIQIQMVFCLDDRFLSSMYFFRSRVVFFCYLNKRYKKLHNGQGRQQRDPHFP